MNKNIERRRKRKKKKITIVEKWREFGSQKKQPKTNTCSPFTKASLDDGWFFEIKKKNAPHNTSQYFAIEKCVAKKKNEKKRKMKRKGKGKGKENKKGEEETNDVKECC